MILKTFLHLSRCITYSHQKTQRKWRVLLLHHYKEQSSLEKYFAFQSSQKMCVKRGVAWWMEERRSARGAIYHALMTMFWCVAITRRWIKHSLYLHRSLMRANGVWAPLESRIQIPVILLSIALNPLCEPFLSFILFVGTTCFDSGFKDCLCRVTTDIRRK